MEYAKYPFKTMNITQNYNHGNHVPHWKNSKNHSDKPWDEACEDSGRSYFEPQNDFVVEEVLGLNSSITNTVRLKSLNKLKIPFKKEEDYLYLTLTHMNEDNLRQVKKGQVLKKGTKRLREGTDGNATGNHFHVTANIGKYYGLLKNTNGKWCYTYEKSLLPHEAFYVDSNFTSIKNAKGSTFQEVPKEQSKEEVKSTTNSFFGSKGYFGLGDNHPNIGKIASFMRKNYSLYTKKEALGNYYGPNIQSSIKEFQKRTGLEADGNVGPKTLAKLKEEGFKE